MVTVKRQDVANRIHDAKEHGDLSENAEYEDAKNEQAFVEGRIQTLEALIKNATIIDEHHSTDHVQIGSTVIRRERRRGGAVHDRRVDRGEAGRGPDLQREPGRSRAARAGRRARRSSCASPPATSPTRSSASASQPVGRHGLGGRTRGSGPRPWTAGRQRLEDAVRDGARRAACADRSSSTSSPGHCAPTTSRRRCSTAWTTSTRWMPRRS